MSARLSPSDPLIDKVLAERYQILHRLGEGAMGVVYKARHVKVGRLFAVKVLHARALVDSKVAKRFEREAELAGRLRHPNVIGVVDVGEVDGTRYMVMDFAEGPDLAKLLDEAPMPPDRIIRLVRQMLDGLHHAHEQGMIHRDFKPENVIVERDRHGAETPRIVDFGIALLREGGDPADAQGRLTTNGLVLGTPHYMAPEQAVADPIDHRIDLFALGIVVYEMLSGRLPFDGSGAEVARANLLLDPPPINKRVPHLEVDPLLEAFARQLMAKKRSARPATAKAARDLLDLIERDRNSAAPVLGVPVARSGRVPAVTENVGADDPTGAGQQWPETQRMKPTPRTSAPVAPPGSSMAVPGLVPGLVPGPGSATTTVTEVTIDPVGGVSSSPLDAMVGAWSGTIESAPQSPAALPISAALWGPEPAVAPVHDAGSAPVAPGMPYPYPPASPPGAYGAPYPPAPGPYGASHPTAAHRDTAMRTPLGWQTSSLPSRRRSWLIGGALVGTASAITATVLSLVGGHREPAAPGDPVAMKARHAPPADPDPVRAAPPGAAAVPVPAASDAVAPAAAAPAASEEAARRGAVAPAAAAPAASEEAARRGAVAPAAAAPVKRAVAAPDRGRGKPAGGAAVGRGDDPRAATAPATSRAPDAAPERREPVTREPPARESPEPRPSRSDPPRAAAVAPGITAAELAHLFDAVKAEIEELPEANRRGLLDRLAMINIMSAMRGSQEQRDDAAARLVELRQRVRDRKATR